MEFERTSRLKIAGLNLIPLIDVLFILIIFFMLTTSFMRIESMELVLPSAAGKAAAKDDVVHLYIAANGDMALGQRKVDQDSLVESLSRMFERDPNTRIMLLTADGVTVQQLVTIMDRITMAGGRSLFVRKWDAKSEKAG
jgi:biopolymer transport protein ExbD